VWGCDLDQGLFFQKRDSNQAQIGITKDIYLKNC
jgi:hypothetical protein